MRVDVNGRITTIPDAEEREKSLDPRRSFIVQAPAGSGKTELLVRRFMTLLAVVESPEQILAVTFTKKAAGEMRRRIIDALEEARTGVGSKGDPLARLAIGVLERDAEKRWDLLGNPGRLKVLTLDSLCSFLVKRMPVLSRLGGMPRVAEKPEELYREAARRTLLMAGADGKEGEAVRQALRHLDNSFADLEKRLIIMLEKRDRWLSHVDLHRRLDEKDLRDHLEGSLRELVVAVLRKVKEMFPQDLLEEVTRFGRYAASNLAGEGRGSPVTALSDLESSPGADPGELPLWRGIRELLLTKDGRWRSPRGVKRNIGFPADGTKEAEFFRDGFRDLLDRLGGEESLRIVLDEVGSIPDPFYDGREWTVLNDLLHLLPVAEEHLAGLFARRGVIDFQGLAMAALDSLGTEENPTDLMLYLDHRIRHILVDEYQDTSRNQLELIKALTRGWEEGDGRTIFVVGDPMQSIYLFRKAEVGLFIETRRRGVGQIRPEGVVLRSNFRSLPAVVEWVNETFRNAFPDEDDPFLGAVRYEEFEPVRGEPGEGTVELRLYDGRNDAAEAAHIVERIMDIRARERGAAVAVLARSRAHLGAVVAAFKREGISFTTGDIDPLLERPVVQDLFALLRALLHPFDRTAWLAVLRAPWCGMTLSDLHILCGGNEGGALISLMYDEGRVGRLSEDGRKRLLMVRDKLGKGARFFGRVHPRALLEGLWVDLGGPACVGEEAMEDAEVFFDMVDSQAAEGSIEIEGLVARMEGLYANHRRKGGNPVEIMTIHGAKGLQFDYVIIPGMGRRSRGRDRELIHFMERDEHGRSGLLVAPLEGAGGGSRIYRYLGTLQRRKEEFERTRLFYVAVTRAKKGLYMYGHVKGVEEGEVKAEPGSFLSSISHVLRPEMVVDAGGDGEDAAAGVVTSPLKRLPASWKMPDPPAPLPVEADMEEVEPPDERPEFLWAGEAIRHLGTVLHRYLCRIAMEGLRRWDAERVAGERERIATLLRQLGLTRKEAAGMSRRGVEILCRAIDDEKGRWILGDHREGATELEISAVRKGKIVRKVIDRTFIDEGDVRWVIDYKISRHDGSDLRRFLEEERERYRAQLDEYAEILESLGERRIIRRGLYYPAQSGWIEW